MNRHDLSFEVVGQNSDEILDNARAVWRTYIRDPKQELPHDTVVSARASSINIKTGDGQVQQVVNYFEADVYINCKSRHY